MHTAEQEKNEVEQVKLRKKQQKEAEAKRARSPEKKKKAIWMMTGEPFKLSILVLQNPSKHLGSTAWRSTLPSDNSSAMTHGPDRIFPYNSHEPSSGRATPPLEIVRRIRHFKRGTLPIPTVREAMLRYHTGFVLPNLTNLFQ